MICIDHTALSACALSITVPIGEGLPGGALGAVRIGGPATTLAAAVARLAFLGVKVEPSGACLARSISAALCAVDYSALLALAISRPVVAPELSTIVYALAHGGEVLTLSTRCADLVVLCWVGARLAVGGLALRYCILGASRPGVVRNISLVALADATLLWLLSRVRRTVLYTPLLVRLHLLPIALRARDEGRSCFCWRSCGCALSAVGYATAGRVVALDAPVAVVRVLPGGVSLSTCISIICTRVVLEILAASTPRADRDLLCPGTGRCIGSGALLAVGNALVGGTISRHCHSGGVIARNHGLFVAGGLLWDEVSVSSLCAYPLSSQDAEALAGLSLVGLVAPSLVQEGRAPALSACPISMCCAESTRWCVSGVLADPIHEA